MTFNTIQKNNTSQSSRVYPRWQRWFNNRKYVISY